MNNALNGYHTGHDRVNRAAFIVFVKSLRVKFCDWINLAAAINDYFNTDKKM